MIVSKSLWISLSLSITTLSIQVYCQNLTVECDTPSFAESNATGYVTLLSPFKTAADGGSEVSNLSTAIYSSDKIITQHFWLETPALSNPFNISEHQTFAACLLMLDFDAPLKAGSPPDTSLGPSSPSNGCNNVLSNECQYALTNQIYNELNYTLAKDNTTGNYCKEVLKTPPPAACNGSMAWSGVTSTVRYVGNPTLYNGSSTCDGVGPLNGTAEKGWLIQLSSDVSRTNNLDSWSQQARVIVQLSYDTYYRTPLESSVLCPTAENLTNAAPTITWSFGILVWCALITAWMAW